MKFTLDIGPIEGTWFEGHAGHLQLKEALQAAARVPGFHLPSKVLLRDALREEQIVNVVAAVTKSLNHLHYLTSFRCPLDNLNAWREFKANERSIVPFVTTLGRWRDGLSIELPQEQSGEATL